MIDFRPALFITGVLLTTLAAAMLVPALADAANGDPGWRVFLASAAVTAFVGISMVLSFRARRVELSIHGTFILTTLSWVTLAVFASLPFAFAGLGLSAADAFFESMSGLTTTGSTVLIGLDRMSAGVLLWRALLQWLGGIGIIAMAVAVLPMLGVGGMQLFRTESSDQTEKAMPRAAQLASFITVLYAALTGVLFAAYWAVGMTPFDAICHAMTTIATGGFSTGDGSIGQFNSAAIDMVAIAGMLIGGMPFVLYLRAVRGAPGALLRDSQVWWFLAICAAMTALFAAWLLLSRDAAPLTALRYAAFNVISVITGTGYATADYGRWGGLAVTLMFFLMFVGGCTGSTTGGIKVFRYQVLFAAARVQIGHLARPHGVFVARYNGKPIPEGVSSAVLGLFFVFFAVFAVTALALALLGLDFVTALSAAATAITNVGPALGPIVGPSGTFAPLSDSAKWVLSAAMLLGRLELFTVLVLFLPSFWRP